MKPQLSTNIYSAQIPSMCIPQVQKGENAYQILKRISKELGMQTNDPKFAPEA